MEKNAIIPDYFAKFICKQSQCRRNCCHDWIVTLSEKDYFHLVGLNCGKRLRKALDISLHVLPNPDKQNYADFARKLDGRCPCETEEGLCELQLKMGEKVLPEVCRVFPRSETSGIKHMSNGCEAVVELLAGKKDPISFSGWDDAVLPNMKKVLNLLQNRDRSFEERLHTLCNGTEATSKLTEVNFLKKDTTLDFISRLSKVFSPSSKVLEKYSTALISMLSGEDKVKQYEAAEKIFVNQVSEYDRIFENLLVNYAVSLPFSENEPTEYVKNICTAYTWLKTICVCHTAAEGSFQSFVDAAVGCFRFFQHNTLFDSIAFFCIDSMYSAFCSGPEKEKNHD